MKELFDYSLLRHNTFGIDAKCKRFVEVSSVEEFLAVRPSVYGREFIIVGGGSNILLTKDYQGTVLSSAILGKEVEQRTDALYVKVGSGEDWDGFVEYCVTNGYHGLENLSLIPGTVGASAVQNIGAYGVEAKDCIYSVDCVDINTGELKTFLNAECGYGYRMSNFKSEWKNRYFITHVTYRLSTTFTPILNYGNIISVLQSKGIDKPSAKELRDTIISIRKEKLPDPAEIGSAGSFFMNPVVSREKYVEISSRYPDMPHYELANNLVKIPAGWLIDQCGWKGKSVGRVGVHEKQALVIVNLGGASGNEVVHLAELIIDSVDTEFGIRLHPEVIFV